VNDIIDACIAQARAGGKRPVFPEGHDERIVAAARRLRDLGIATPLLSARGERAAAARAGRRSSIDVLDPARAPGSGLTQLSIRAVARTQV
jgi:phosphotransacetylase